MKQLPDGYTVYCDESRHSDAQRNPYMAIGGLWVPTNQKKQLTVDLRQLFNQHGLGSEVKWTKTSNLKFDAYRAIIDFFFDNPINFRAIVVEQDKLNYPKFKEGDEELGFYTFYYEMLIKWLDQPGAYNILLDFKKNRGDSHYEVLKRCLRNKVPVGSRVSGLHVIDSYESPLAQVADLLTGAIAASWCNVLEGTPKARLAEYIASRAGKRSLREHSSSPAFHKLNIFRIILQ